MTAKTVASKKAKGRRLQQWVRDQILDLSKDFHPEDVKSTPMGVTGEDVQLSRYVRDFFPYMVECKSVAATRHPIHTYMDQAKAHGPHEPLLVIKQDRKRPVVVLDAEHFFKLIKRSIENEM
jgi:hypothetical protein